MTTLKRDEVIDLREGVDHDLVTVVIPCRNEEDFIDVCLESVQQQTYQNIEIIVVDGMSDDRTREILAERASHDPRLRMLDNPARIVSPGLNVALADAQGRWLVRIDAHCAVPTDYVERVIRHLQTGKYGGVGGLKLGVGQTTAGRAIAAAMASPIGVGNSKYHHGDEAQTVEHVPFGAYPVALARELGGWDESVVVNQDFEFDHRVTAAGKPILFDPDVVINWHCRQSLPDLFRQYRRYGRGKSVVTRLHPDSVRPRHLIPAAFVAGLALLVLPAALVPVIARLRLGVLGSYAAVLIAGAATATSTDGGPLTRRERALVALAFATMHIGQGVGFWTGLLGSPPKPPVIQLDELSPVSAEAVIDLRDNVEVEDVSAQDSPADVIETVD